MPKVIVKYKNKRTLKALQDFSKYFDYDLELFTYNAKDFTFISKLKLYTL